MPSYLGTQHNTYFGRQVDIWRSDADELYIHDRLGSGQTFRYEESHFERTHAAGASSGPHTAQPPAPTNARKKSKSKSPDKSNRSPSPLTTWAAPKISVSRLTEGKQLPASGIVTNDVSGGHTWRFDLASVGETGRGLLVANLVEPLMDSVTQWLNEADGHQREDAMFALDNMYNNVHELLESDKNEHNGKVLVVATDKAGKFVGMGALSFVGEGVVLIDALAGNPSSVSKAPNAPRASGGAALHAAYTVATAHSAKLLRLKAAWSKLHDFYARHGFEETTPGWYECHPSAYKAGP